jgi:hypothetical protein
MARGGQPQGIADARITQAAELMNSCDALQRLDQRFSAAHLD